MAEKRRLQGDIDRTLKKVNEGRITFKETLEKFESATNHAQKEKHEADLKKEIKKLQRFRDSIKTWLTSPDVKDKASLTDIRKLIESDMERFKVIEKETKTKAYSKEGLYSDQKKDPAQKERDEQQDWLRIQISKLQKKAENCDFELHNINAKRKRNADRDRMGEVSQRLGMYRSHIDKQETILRLLDNDKIDFEKVKDLRFLFEDFLGNPDHENYKADQGMFMYDPLNLDQLSADLTIASELEMSSKEISSSLVVDSLGFNVAPVMKETSVEALTAPVESHDVPRSVIKERIPNKVKHRPDPPKSISITSTPIKTSVNSLDAQDYLLGHNLSDSSIKESTNDSVAFPTLNSSQSLKTITTPVLESVSYIEPQPLREINIADVVKSTVNFSDSFSVLTTSATTIPNLSSTQEPLLRSKLEMPPPLQFPETTHIASSSHNAYFDLSNNFIPMMQQQQNEFNYQHLNMARPPMQSLRPTSNITMSKDNTFDMILEPGDAMSPFRNHNFQLNDVYNNQVIAMEHGRNKQSLSSDLEKARMIIYKNEVPVPDIFPREPILGSDSEEYYMQLDSDTLFFIFYYFEGTRAQYLAAKALKRMSWRFHTGHMCWFQRHEEPKQITDNSESGTYIFYDFESMSRQKKENFTFSYNYLEDKDF